MQIATKVGFVGGLAPDVVQAACEASLKRLQTDRIDLYYEHTDDEKVPLADSLGAFEALRKQGKIREIGLSQFEPARLAKAVETAKANGIRPPCVLQSWYNLLERQKLEGPLLDAAMANGVSVMPFYALANGFLTGKYRSRDDLQKSVRGLRNGLSRGQGVAGARGAGFRGRVRPARRLAPRHRLDSGATGDRRGTGKCDQRRAIDGQHRRPDPRADPRATRGAERGERGRGLTLMAG